MGLSQFDANLTFPRLTFWTRHSFLGEIRTLKALSGDFRTLGAL